MQSVFGDSPDHHNAHFLLEKAYHLAILSREVIYDPSLRETQVSGLSLFLCQFYELHDEVQPRCTLLVKERQRLRRTVIARRTCRGPTAMWKLAQKIKKLFPGNARLSACQWPLGYTDFTAYLGPIVTAASKHSSIRKRKSHSQGRSCHGEYR